MLFKLEIANNTILSFFFFFFFLIIDLYLSIVAGIAQVFSPISEIVIPIRIPTKKGKAEMKTHPVIIEVTISKWSK